VVFNANHEILTDFIIIKDWTMSASFINSYPPPFDADPGFALIGVDVELSHISGESCTCAGCCT